MIELDRDEIGRPAEEGARLVALRLLDEAALALARLDRPGDVEALHDFRVGVRRLRSSLRAYLPYLEREPAQRALAALSDFGARTNRARDLEVQIEWLEARSAELRPVARRALARLVRSLGTRVARAYAAAQEGVPEAFASLQAALRGSLEAYRAWVSIDGAPRIATFAGATAALLDQHAQELARLLAEVASPTDERAHRARIQAKRLRYLLEPVAQHLEDGRSLVTALKSLQDVFGELNDLRALEATLRHALEMSALTRAQALAGAALAGDPQALRAARRRDPESGLLAIAGLLADRREKLFAAAQAEWLGARGGAFAARVAAAARELRESAPPPREIERKYLLDALPERARDARSFEIEQGWLPGERVRERLRRRSGDEGERYFRTLKLGSGLTRTEIEQEISRELFERLWPLTAGSRVRKRRHVVPDGELRWEIDVFENRDLVLAEVELPRPDTPAPLPDWLAPHVLREVTGDPRYENVNLGGVEGDVPR